MHTSGRVLNRVSIALVLVTVLILLGVCVAPLFVPSRNGSRRMDCRNGLKRMNVYFDLYRTTYRAYPEFGTGAESWFGQVWRPTMATDGNLFRCAQLGWAGTGTHYWCIVRGGEWPTPTGPFRFSSPKDLESPTAPSDLPIACDQLDPASNHGEHKDVLVLRLSGRVDIVECDSEFVRHPPAFLGPSGWEAPAGTR